MERNLEKKNKKIIGHQNYVYLLSCNDGSLYCGWSTDLQQRVNKHNSGKGAKYTQGRRPVTLVYSEACASKQEAMKREWQIKQLSRRQKLKLIHEFQKEQGEKHDREE